MSDAASTWDGHAVWWQEQFTAGADPEYEQQILPLAERELAGRTRVLDLGCGEGQLSRRIAAQGASVVGLDPSRAQVAEATRRGGGPAFGRAGAADLPLRTASVDAVVVCLVFEHVDDLDAAIAEVARVLAPGGVFVLFLNHPLLQPPGSCWVDDHVCEPPEQYWRVGPYLGDVRYAESVTAEITVDFVHRPLHRYVNALAGHRLLVTHMEEPAPPPGFLALAPEYGQASSIPRLMLLRAERGEDMSPGRASGPR